MPEANPLHWPLDALLGAYRRGELSPVEVTEQALARIDAFDPALNAFLVRLDARAREQAAAAERAWRDGTPGPLAGVPIAIKDTFALAGAVTTFGSRVHAEQVSTRDSGVVRRLRAAGAVFTGKTNTAEFGQSATTDNRLRDDCRNPWDVARTPGGSSGGAAASVAAGLSSVAVGADGGGSIRIPAAFSGLFGIKPTLGACPDEGGLRAMSDFCCPGPLAWRAADARRVLEVLCEASLPRREVPRSLRIAWDPHPEGRPVDPALAGVVARAVETLAALGHAVARRDLPIAGWNDVFPALVLDEERRERGHLLDESADRLTGYEAKTLRAAQALGAAEVEGARALHPRYRERIGALFEDYDLIVTPTTATPAFVLGERPAAIAGRPVDRLWGAFPFTSPFNVSGNPAASVPCGLAHGLPVGLQIVARHGADALLLDLAEQLEEALAFDAGAVRRKWTLPALAPGVRA
jgi:aspartyl-tRNA(Asn)/glutamyl-tRNA(Gln) amidotransferase subunit A